jgi:hypothetical protein
VGAGQEQKDPADKEQAAALIVHGIPPGFLVLSISKIR